MQIFNRRLLSETAVSCGIVLLMTVGIFSVVKLLALLRRAVQGHLPFEGLGMILTFKLTTFLDVILPPTIFIAVFLVLIRWNRDNEITIFATGGIGPFDYLRPAATVAAVAALVVALLAFFVTPAAELGYQHALEKYQLTTKSAPFKKGQFRSLNEGRDILYYSPYSDQVMDPVRLFYLRDRESEESIIVAEKGIYEFNFSDGVEKIEINTGTQYWMNFESLEFQETNFDSLVDQIPNFSFSDSKLDVKSKPTAEIIQSDAPRDKAELNWRISKVLAMGLVVMLAFAWGTAASRSKIAVNFIGAIMVYFVYSTLLGFVADLNREGDINSNWLVALPHLAMLTLIFVILLRSRYNRSFTSVVTPRRA